ncbi:MAG: 50S ribosomal protein L35 [Limnochordaceae bacterium]|nr:50S ribosomal protein L35 [Limnochordaceae bacterium]
MPKMKTHRGAAKRFRATASGRLRRRHAYHSHLLGPKSPDRKRRLTSDAFVSEREMPRIRRMLPYSQYL